jgi:hypothetical protein
MSAYEEYTRTIQRLEANGAEPWYAKMDRTFFEVLRTEVEDQILSYPDQPDVFFLDGIRIEVTNMPEVPPPLPIDADGAHEDASRRDASYKDAKRNSTLQSPAGDQELRFGETALPGIQRPRNWQDGELTLGNPTSPEKEQGWPDTGIGAESDPGTGLGSGL